MASAAVNGAALAVSYVGNGSGGTTASTSPGGGGDDDSSPDGGGQLCLYTDDSDEQQQRPPSGGQLNRQPPQQLLANTREEMEDELAATTSADGEDDVIRSKMAGQGGGACKRPASALDLGSPYDDNSATTPVVPPTSPGVSQCGVIQVPDAAPLQASSRSSTKKRRKQSNPVRLTTSARVCNADQDAVVVDFGDDDRSDILDNSSPTPPSPSLTPGGAGSCRQLVAADGLDLDEDLDEGELSPRDDFDGSVYRCPHCNVLFGAEEHLRMHVEEEHVQKALERQLQQHNQKNHLIGGATAGNVTTASFGNLTGASPFDLSSPVTFRLNTARPSDGGPSSEPSNADCKKQDILLQDRVSSSSTSNMGLFLSHQQQPQHHPHATSSCSSLVVAATSSSSCTSSTPSTAATLALHSPSDVAGLMALSAFGATPFLIPVLPCGNVTTTSARMTTTTPAATSSGLLSGGGPGSATPLRIFNPEAFCELCNKEFCNKYFLKTHKANKHGIYSIETLAGVATPTVMTTSGVVVSQGTTTSFTGSKLAMAGTGGRPPPPGSGGSPLATLGLDGGTGNNGTAANNTPLPPPPPGGGGSSIMGSCTSGLTSVLMGAQPMVGKALPVMNPEAFCDICQKEFCNKYFLKKHRQKIHGILDFSLTNSFGSSMSGPMNPLNEPAAAAPPNNNSDIQNASSGSNGANGSAGTVGGQHHHQSAELFYEYGARDLSAKIAAATQALLQKHSIQTIVAAPSGAANVSSSTTAANNLSAISTVPASHFSSGTGGPGSGGLDHTTAGGITVAGHVFSPERLREMGVINVDAFCELCCKEFCNKYFLRTHKMNKHGIGSLVGFEGGGLQAGITTGVPGTAKGSSSSALAQHQQHQSVPLSLVMDKEVNEDGGRKSTTPNGSSSNSLNGSGSVVTAANDGGSGSVLAPPPSGSCQDFTQESSSGGGDPTCDVCSRPFSSTYLLKMHKFYFHSIDQSTASAVNESGASGDGCGKQGPSSLSHPLSSPEGSDPRCDSTSSQKSGGPNALDVDEFSVSAVAAGASGAAPPLNEDLQRLQTMIRELNTSPKDGSVKCNVCFREMKNKYFLRAHMMNEHGELHNEDDMSSLGGDGVQRSGSNSTTNGTDREGGTVDISSSSQLPCLPLANDKGTSGIPADHDSYCDICGKEFCSKYFLRTHKITVHGVGGPQGSSVTADKMTVDVGSAAPIPLPVAIEAIKMEGVPHPPNPLPPPVTAANLSPISTSLPLQIATSTANVISSALQQQVAAIPMLTATERPPMTAVTGRNFCEICNKELCNKYFMKTHMLKMHGINVDEKSTGINGATIGGVTCDICQKELCSKYFLKVHKQNTHGIYEEPSLAKDTYAASAAAAAAAVAAAAAITTSAHVTTSMVQQQQHHHHHLVDKESGTASFLHGGDGNASDGGGGSSTGSGGNRYFSHYTEVCPLCDRRFKSIKWLKTHVINDHADLAKDSGLADLLGNTEAAYLSNVIDQSLQQHMRIASHSHPSYHQHPVGTAPLPHHASSHPLHNDHSSPLHHHHHHHHHHSAHPHLPRDFALGPEVPFAIKVEKASSASSSSTTSPNNNNNSHNNASSPFHVHPHHQTAMMSSTSLPSSSSSSSHHPLALLGTTGAEADAAGGGGSTTAGHHAGELGSTGVAATATTAGGGVAAGVSTTISGNSSTSSSSPSPASSAASCLPLPSMGMTTATSSAAFGSGGSGGATCLVSTRKPLGSGNGTRIYHCSYCSYSTRWLSNLYAHEKRHTGLSSEGEKRFCCRVCHRAYRYNHSLQRHLVSHKTTGMLLKHVVVSSNQVASTTPAPPLHLSTTVHTTTSNAAVQQQHQLLMMTSSSPIVPSRASSISSQAPLSQDKGRIHKGDDDILRDKDEDSNDGSATRSGISSTTRAEAAAGTSSLPPPSQSSKPVPGRVKKYRCSKCGAKYRSREQCLEHIHMNHNTRSRHLHHVHHYHHQQHSTTGQRTCTTAAEDEASDVITATTTTAAAAMSPVTCPLCPFACSGQDAMASHVATKHHRRQEEDEDEEGEEEDDEGEEEDRELPATDGSDESGDVSAAAAVAVNHQHHLEELQQLSRSQQLPMTYAVPQTPPTAGSFIMQPFLISQPEDNDCNATGGGSVKSVPSNTFVPSLVYLPVSHKVNETVTVAFTLSPA